MVKYIKWKARKRGIPKQDGALRTCMNCTKRAVVSAVTIGDTGLRMDIWLCKGHAEYAKSLQ